MRTGFILIILSAFTFLAFGQEPETETKTSVDTSEYAPDDIDFNLLVAAFHGYESEVLRLLNKGANINTQTDEGITPLNYAVSGGYLKTVKILTLNGANVHLKDWNGISPLISASKNGFTEIAEELIRAGASPNDKDRHGVTPLIYSSAYNYYVLSDMLLYYGADPNLSDKKSTTPLMAAVYGGNLKIAKNLLQKGADPNKGDKSGTTALMFATQTGDSAIVSLLLRHGSDLSIRDNAGYNAFYYAAYNGHQEILDQLWNYAPTDRPDLSKNPVPYYTPLLKKKRELKKWIQKHEIETKFKPVFSTIPLGMEMVFAKNDFFLGFYGGITEQKTGITTSLGYHFRPSQRGVLVNTGENEYYQFWEKINILSLSFSKSFPLILINNRFQAGFYGKLSGNYSFGPDYRGSSTQPENRFKISPEAGFSGESKNFIYRIGYTLYNMEYIDGNPHQLRFGFFYKLNSGRKIFSNKVIKWF